MRQGFLSFAIGCLAAPLSPLPASAAPTTAPIEAPAEDVEASRLAVAGMDIDRLVSDPAFAGEMIVHLDRLAAVAAGDPGTSLAIDNLRLLALVTLERADEARAVIDRSLGRRPNEASSYAALWYAALSLGDSQRGLAVVEQASRNVSGVGWSELREILDRNQVFSLFQQFQAQRDKASRGRLAEALLRIGWPGPGSREIADSVRLVLIEHRLEQGDRAAAADLAAGVMTPSNVASLIVRKRFDGLFPAGMDRLARLRQALEEHDRHTAELQAAAPQDMGRLVERSQLLRTLGRDGDALGLLRPFIADPAATATREEQGMWVVNEATYALIALGRKDEAVALMGRLAALPLAEHPYLISADINYGEVLWEAGRYADSLAHARRLESEFLEFASDYGTMWIRATIVCALASLERAAEAAPTLALMQAQSDGNPAAMMRALLCLDDMAAAERLMVSRLDGDDPEQAVLALQDYALVPAAAGPDPILERLMALRERPAVRAALERVGRIVQLPVARTYWGGV
ncbi:MAG TPA: hypothetical protein VN231_03755 [Allosphingosinicella sp.]|nr:hypothetical protein [Allosphingosinicella sp.]